MDSKHQLQNNMLSVIKEMDVKEQNKRRSARFRERQRDILGEAKYKEEQARKRRERRKKASQLSLNEHKNSVDDLMNDFRKEIIHQIGDVKTQGILKVKDNIQHIVKQKVLDINQRTNCDGLLDVITLDSLVTSGKRISKSTIEGYLSKIKYLYGIMTNKKFNCKLEDFKIFNNTKKTKAFIFKKWPNDRSKQAYTGALTGILRRLAGFDESAEFYSNLTIELNTKNQNERKHNRLSLREKRNGIVDWKIISKLYKKADNLFDKALLAVYTLVPPRRLKDYKLMKIASIDDDEDPEMDLNYLILDKKGKPINFVYNNYKTFKKFGTFINKIPATLSTILKKYIKEYDKEDGDFLFETQTNGYFKDFSTLVSTTFGKYLDGVQRQSVNILRHSFVNHIASGKQLSIAKREQIAMALGHSTIMFDYYRRLDDDEDER